MDKSKSLEALSALAHETRLDVFRLLYQHGDRGLCAGQIAAELDARQNTISTNLAILTRAGLIRSHREGRSVRYFADTQGMNGLLEFLLADCCGRSQAQCHRILEAEPAVS